MPVTSKPLFGDLIAAHDGLADELKAQAVEPVTGERAKVGDSSFESWYGETKIQQMGTKQRYREAYEAGLNEAQQVAVPTRECPYAGDPSRVCNKCGQRHGTPTFQQQVVPDGYALIPIEPTPEIIDAMTDVLELSYNPSNAKHKYKAKHTYAAMLAAAQGVSND